MWDIWEFIVSGRLPGTTIQITFGDWLYIVSGLLLCAVLRSVVRQYRLHRRLQKLQMLQMSERPIEAFVKH